MLLAVIAYLIGSMPLGFLLRRANVLHVPAAALSISADLFTGVLVAAVLPKLPYLTARFGLGLLAYPLANEAQLGACALICAALGHYFSVYICGWGGLGTALIMGGFLILTPYAALWAFAVTGFVLLVTRRMKYASLAGGLALPFLVRCFYPLDFIYLGAALICALLLVFTHTSFLRDRA
ncbi:glycerol-3-phosphate acyltransferase [bacterium]|nr:glycerol-3-phosphate acyltransferase [bacterium]